MTKILIISINYAPEQIGVSKYTTETAEYLADQGFDVRVIATFPFYPEWKRYPGYKSWWWQSETINGVKVIRCPSYVPAHVTLRNRLLHLCSFGITSNLAVLSQIWWQPDHVLLLMPTFVPLPAAGVVSRLCRSKAWLHVQDFELDLALRIVADSDRASTVVREIERLIYRPFDIVSSISQTMLDRLLEEKGVRQSQLYYFPNWVDITDVFPLPYPFPYRQEWDVLPDDIVVLYAGNFGQKYDFDLVLQAAHALRQESLIQFVLCGDGAVRPQIEAQVADLPNVRLLPLQPQERVNELLNAADIHLLPQKSGAQGSVMPSKLLNIFASGRPVVATVHPDSEVGRIVQRVGRVTPPSDVPAFVRTIKLLAADPELRSQLGSTAIDYVGQEFPKDVVLGRFLTKLRDE